jgi:hypothetical protein
MLFKVLNQIRLRSKADRLDRKLSRLTCQRIKRKEKAKEIQIKYEAAMQDLREFNKQNPL